MPQLPFDFTPDDPLAAPSATTQPVAGEPMSVGELSSRIVQALETLPETIRVIGEISNFNRSRNGHWYFSLKDDSALIDCAMWSSRARGISFEPLEGDAIEATGHVEHYAKQGRTQLIVERILPGGQGTLQARFKAMCAELRQLGWFEDEHKQSLPILPRRIAVLTAAGSAALADVRRTTADRCPSVALLLVDVPVQGEGAAARIVQAIRCVDAAAERLEVDAILLTRGGGSLEDLWAFNEREVAEAVFNCRTPIVAAIGHESDTSIADLVADHRASTPTQAVMALMPGAEELHHQLDDRAHRLLLLLRRRLEQARMNSTGRLDRLQTLLQLDIARRRRAIDERTRVLVQRRPAALLAARRAMLVTQHRRMQEGLQAWHQARVAWLGNTAHGMADGTGRMLQAARMQLQARDATLEAVAPQAVLERGFSLTLDEDGHVVRAAASLQEGSTILTQMARGRVQSRVEAVDADGSGTVDSP